MTPTTTADPGLRDAAAVLGSQRRRLFGIAHRIVNDASDAEDVVQDVWIRWQRVDREQVRNPSAFLTTATTRVAINVLQSARVRHEAAASAWLDDVAGTMVDPQSDPLEAVERADGVERAIRVLLEHLNPTERAAFVLRTCFDYPYRAIADLLGLNVANVRQLVSRAQRRVHTTPARSVNTDVHRRLVRAFVTAARSGDLLELEQVLASDAAAGATTTRVA
ncbi:sigma-70 family RNA polymerase sigma factor [Cellulomonas sp. P5_E12]